MSVCKHRVMDKCKKYDRPCIFNTDCFEPEEEKRMTNADLIRAMTDEELGVWICKHALSCGCCVGVELCRSDDGIANGAVKWLQQPAEEDHHDSD